MTLQSAGATKSKDGPSNLFVVLAFVLAMLMSVAAAGHKTVIEAFRTWAVSPYELSISEEGGVRTVAPTAPPSRSQKFFSAEVDFTINPAAQLDNLMQTADTNSGFRIEASGQNVGFVITDPSQPNGLFGKILAANFANGQKFNLRVKILDQGELSVELRDPNALLARVVMQRHVANFDHILFGKGFSPEQPERRWTGTYELKNVHFGQTITLAKAYLWFGCLWVLAFALELWLIVRAAAEHDEPRPRETDRGTLDLLGVLRVVAFVSVAMAHGTLIDFRSADLHADLGHRTFSLFSGSPWLGVAMFFVLSGYLMGKILLYGGYDLSKKGILWFYVCRMAKLYPLYVVIVLVIACFRMGTGLDSVALASLFNVFVFNYAGNLPFNPVGALWSVATEFQFYAIAPIIALVAGRLSSVRGAVLALAGVLAAGLLLRFTVWQFVGEEGWYSFIYTPLYANLDLFVVGIVTAVLVAHLPKWSTVLLPLGAIVLLIGLWAINGRATALSILD